MQNNDKSKQLAENQRTDRKVAEELVVEKTSINYICGIKLWQY